MRQIDSVTLQQKFEPYDIKCTGFVSIDAFSSVMRKLDIFLPPDVASTIISRFSAVSGGKFDYVDFCQIVATSLRPRSPPAQVHPISQVINEMPPLSGSAAERPDQHFSRSDPGGRVAIDTASFRARPNYSKLLKLNLPVIETNFNPMPPGPQQQRIPSKRSEGEASGWKCPVCFHQQTRVTSTCEICAAQNPASVEFQSLRQCSACGFRNKLDARTCELCTVVLRRSQPPPNNGVSFSPTKRYYAPSSATAPCDGWLT